MARDWFICYIYLCPKKLMNKAIFINQATCKQCTLCAEICPNKIFEKSYSGEITIRTERIDTCFKCGQCMAVCGSKSVFINELSYEKDFFELPQTEQDDVEKSFSNLIITRRAIRNFKEKAVPRTLLEKIVEAISFAPPGFPPLKTKIIVIQNTELIRQSLPNMISFYEKLLENMNNPIARFFIKKEAGKKTFKTMKEHLVPLLTLRMPALKNGTEDTLTRNAPAMILFIADKNGEDISQDVSVAATYGMLTAHSLGLGGSIMDIIPPAINRDKNLRKVYEIKDEEEILTSMILGYPKYKYKRGIKRNLKEVRWI